MSRSDLRNIEDVLDEYPTMECPKCKHVSPDMDGFGVMYCTACGYCKHASITDDVCNFCGSPEQHKPESTT